MAGGLSLPGTMYHLGLTWLRVNVLRQRVPLLMSWNLTFHCNLRCTYCNSPYLKVPELKTDAILEGIDRFYDLGTRWITFSGGEPLLRKDIGTIVDHCKDKGITVFISTNGTLVPRRMEDIANVDRITISLDGAGETHDRVRGEGAWEQATKAIEVIRERGIPVALTCVLSAHNLDCVDEVLELAERFDAHVMFQPATKWLDSSDKPNPIAPETEPYRRTIDYLLRRKQEGARITNSPAGLRYLRHWPDPAPIRSTSGWVTCSVEPDGKVIASHLTSGAILEEPLADDTPPWERFKTMSVPRKVDQSWCGPILELDLVFGLNPSAILNAVRVQA